MLCSQSRWHTATSSDRTWILDEGLFCCFHVLKDFGSLRAATLRVLSLRISAIITVPSWTSTKSIKLINSRVFGSPPLKAKSKVGSYPKMLKKLSFSKYPLCADKFFSPRKTTHCRQPPYMTKNKPKKPTKQTTASIHFINLNLQIWGKGQLEVMSSPASLLASMPKGSVAVDLLFVRITQNSSVAASHKACKQLLEMLPPKNTAEWYPTCETDKCLWEVQRCMARSRQSPGARQSSITLPHASSTAGCVLPHPLPASSYRWDWKKPVQSSGWSVCQWALFEIYQLLMANFVLHE